MTERKEPTINAIRPEQDEIANHRQRSGAPKNGGPAPVRPVIVKSKLAPFALFVALIGVGGAGFSFWQLQQTQVLLDGAEKRIVELEKQLEMTGDESTASMTAVQAKLKWADSEIRKLWGVSYDRNRKAIAENEEKIAGLTKGAKSVDGKINAALKETNAEIRLINDLLDSQQTSMTSIENNAQDQLAQVQALSDKVRKLEQLEAELKRRVSTNEEAIKAIDAFRRSVNQKLLQLGSTAAVP